ncbi:inositol monophosphatase family protein [Komagataeibacter rhaeticus]|nr:inositol monophosphatase family protein [Komagataeibacter rhaeticus]
MAADPAILDGLATAGLAFVIDPIDGTANYAAGVPLFGVMVSVVVDGQAAGGAILDPVCDVAAFAAHGQGRGWKRAAASRGRCMWRPRARARDGGQCVLALPAARSARRGDA